MDKIFAPKQAASLRRRAYRDVLVHGSAQELIERLALKSLMVLPLRGHGPTAGRLSLSNSPAHGNISQLDLDTATEMAVRAGLALDNVHLYGQPRGVDG